MAWHRIMTCYFCIIETARIDLTMFSCNHHKTIGIELCSPLIYKFRPLRHFVWISNIKTKLIPQNISPWLFSLPFFSICTCLVIRLAALSCNTVHGFDIYAAGPCYSQASFEWKLLPKLAQDLMVLADQQYNTLYQAALSWHQVLWPWWRKTWYFERTVW